MLQAEFCLIFVLTSLCQLSFQARDPFSTSALTVTTFPLLQHAHSLLSCDCSSLSLRGNRGHKAVCCARRACYIQTHSRFHADRTPFVPPCILLISRKRSSQHQGYWGLGVGAFCRGDRGWGWAPCWVLHFVQHAKASPCSPWMPTPPTVACMLVPDWH